MDCREQYYKDDSQLAFTPLCLLRSGALVLVIHGMPLPSWRWRHVSSCCPSFPLLLFIFPPQPKHPIDRHSGRRPRHQPLPRRPPPDHSRADAAAVPPPPLSAAGPRLILVDVRSAAERAVSTLPTALSPAQFQALLAADLAGATVVPYCTVGLRSGAWGRRLLRASTANGRDGSGGGGGGGGGDTGSGSAPPPGLDVRNGEGVLLWAHGGGQLVAPGAGSAAAAAASPCVRTRRLHAFSGRYAALLPPGVEPVVFGWWAGLTTTLSAGAQVVWQLLRGAA